MPCENTHTRDFSVSTLAYCKLCVCLSVYIYVFISTYILPSAPCGGEGASPSAQPSSNQPRQTENSQGPGGEGC